MPKSSSLVGTVVGVLVGLVVLVAAVGFAVGLPKLAGDSAGSQQLPDDILPADLAGGTLVTSERFDEVAWLGESTELAITQIEEVTVTGADELSEVFGGEVAAQIYLATDRQAQVEVAVIPGEPGLFKPGLPSDPDAAHETPWFEAAAYGDARCVVAWGADQQTEASGGLPAAVQCQRGEDGRTFDIRSAGMDVEETVAALNDVVSHARDR